MTPPQHNGHANGKGGWNSVAPAGVVLMLLGGLGAVMRDADRQRWEGANERLRLLEARGLSMAEIDGRQDERVAKALEGVGKNAARIEAAFVELDTKIQREFALADDTLRSELRALDERLQGEITRNATERISSYSQLWDEITRLRDWIDTNRWRLP